MTALRITWSMWFVGTYPILVAIVSGMFMAFSFRLCRKYRRMFDTMRGLYMAAEAALAELAPGVMLGGPLPAARHRAAPAELYELVVDDGGMRSVAVPAPDSSRLLDRIQAWVRSPWADPFPSDPPIGLPSSITYIDGRESSSAPAAEQGFRRAACTTCGKVFCGRCMGCGCNVPGYRCDCTLGVSAAAL